jgi:D-alanyl-D-alanine carboxypeptidase
MSKITLTLVFIFCLFGRGLAQQPPANIAGGLDALFQGHVSQTQGLVPGHVIRIEHPGQWVYENAAGLAVVNPASPVQPDMKFKVASITKMFTTVAIFKLIQDGKLDFNAPISTYLPASLIQGFDDYQNIKVKNLLSHTSGIIEPQSDFQGRLNYWIYKKRFQDIPKDSLFKWSYGPGQGLGNYNYSNANYYVLAEIIDAVTPGTYQDYITNNIINPLGLTNTDFNTIPSGSFMRGYLKGSFYPNGGVPDGLEPDTLYDFTEASNSWGYGAADIWSNTTDLIKFHKALFNGQLITTKWIDTMKTILTITGDMGSYGYGMMQFNAYNNGPVYAYGHTGTAFGYGAMLAYIPALDVYMCSAGNYMKIGQEFLQRDINNFLQNNIPADVNDIAANLPFNIYPNPAVGYLDIRTSIPRFTVAVYDMKGDMLMQQADAKRIDLSAIPAGQYILQLSDNSSSKKYVRKFIRS